MLDPLRIMRHNGALSGPLRFASRAADTQESTMQSPRRRHRHESWEAMRQRIIAETSAYLTECLRHPELATRIPVIESGKGQFPRSLTPAFWEPLLHE